MASIASPQSDTGTFWCHICSSSVRAELQQESGEYRCLRCLGEFVEWQGQGVQEFIGLEQILPSSSSAENYAVSDENEQEVMDLDDDSDFLPDSGAGLNAGESGSSTSVPAGHGEDPEFIGDSFIDRILSRLLGVSGAEGAGGAGVGGRSAIGDGGINSAAPALGIESRPIAVVFRQNLGGGNGGNIQQDDASGLRLREILSNLRLARNNLFWGNTLGIGRGSGMAFAMDGGEERVPGAAGRSFEDLLHHLMMTESSHGANPVNPAVLASLERRVVCGETDRANIGECNITFEPFDEGEIAVILPCSHAYKQSSIEEWFRTHNTCPVCRKQLPSV